MEWDVSPWVAQNRDRVGFGLQVFPNDTPGKVVEHVINVAEMAEMLGFDAFFMGDHPAWGLDSWIHLPAVAMETKRIRIGTMVNCVYYRHPLLLARMAADLDNLSSGRLLLGVGAGWDANEFANFGLPFPPARERQAALEEAVTILNGAWGEEPFTFGGETFSVVNAHISPPPRQTPHLPMILAGGGEKVTLRLVAQYADACNLLAYGEENATRTAEDARRKIAALRGHCAALGRPFDTVLRTHLTGWLILAENEWLLERKLRRYFPGGVEERYHGPWRGFAVGCTPGRAVQMYQELADAGIQYFVVQTLDASDVETVGLLAQEVAPRVIKRVSA